MQFIVHGLQVLIQPGYRKFIMIPLLINIILFVILTAFMVQLFNDSFAWFLNLIPDWLINLAPTFFDVIDYIIFALTLILFLVGYGLSFSIITNILAAPFNGLLAEKIQKEAGVQIPEISLKTLIWRTLGREMTKLLYFIKYGLLVAIGLFVLSYVPFINLAVPVIAFVWSAWCMAIQYLDYAADNNGQSFHSLRKQAKRPYFSTMGFGAVVAGLFMLPIVNIFVMPVAVAGGTRLWLQKIANTDELESIEIKQINTQA